MLAANVPPDTTVHVVLASRLIVLLEDKPPTTGEYTSAPAGLFVARKPEPTPRLIWMEG